MDEISREPLPENPGQRVGKRGDRGSELEAWDAAAVGAEDTDAASSAVDRGLDGLELDGHEAVESDEPGGFDRQELLMALNRLPEDGGDKPQEDAEPQAAEESPSELQDASAWEDAEETAEQEFIALEEADEAAAQASEEQVGEMSDEDEEISAAADPELDTLGLVEDPEPLDDTQLSRVLCGLLIAARDGSSTLRLAQATDTSPKQVRAALQVLAQTLEHSGLPLELAIHGESVRLLTAPDVFEHIRKLKPVKKAEKLSAAALETLAVIAYRQPVIRAEIEAIRGVKAGPILKTLMDHKMIKVAGRADVPGRPLQYGTTQHFLETFGLESIKDLPSVKEFRSL